MDAIGVPNEEKLMKFNPGKDLLLGSLQDNLYQFIKKREQFSLEKDRKDEKLNVSKLNQEIRIARRRIESAKRQRETLEKELMLARDEFTRQNNLFQSNLTTINKVKDAEANRLDKERELQAAESEITIIKMLLIF